MEHTDYEYSVEQKREGRLKLLTCLLLLGYVAFAVGAFVILYVTRLIPLGAVVPIFLWMLVFFTWRYVQVDNKYVIESGKLTFIRIYGNRTKRVITEFKIKDALTVVPLKENKDRIKEFSPERVYSALPSVGCDDAYAALYHDNKGVRCVFMFQATSQAIKVLHYYNDKTVVTQTKC